MPITSITKPIARQLGAQVEGLLQEFCKQHGLTVAYDGGRFDPDTFTMKVTLRVKDPSAVAGVCTPTFAFKRGAVMLGLPEDCMGKVTMVNGVGYRITDIKLNRYKYPVSATRLSDNKKIKMPAETVKAGLLP